jgi:HEAT repeat protein
MAFDTALLDAAFTALKAFDWGADAAAFKPIDEATIAAPGDAALRGDLEKRLTAVLGAGPSRAAKEYACRKLSMIGTAGAVPALAALLPDKDHSHMARFALERIGGPEAADALRRGLDGVAGDLRIGMISSLGARRDVASVPALTKLLAGDEKVAVAAAEALGMLATAEADAALAAAKLTDTKPSGAVAAAVVDARLACAEALISQGKRNDALAVYKALAAAAAGKPEAKSVELAATRGILACLDTLAAS